MLTFSHSFILFRGIDIGNKKHHQSNGRRTAPKSEDPYLLLLVKVIISGGSNNLEAVHRNGMEGGQHRESMLTRIYGGTWGSICVIEIW